MKKVVKLVLNIIPRTILTRLSYIIKPLIKIYLFGNKYTDPIDGSSFRKFLPYGYNNVRLNALSPSTFSLERHRLLWLYLKRETDFFEKKIKVLHFAPEKAFLSKFKKLENISYDTIDLNSPLADIKADICNLPLKDNTYDFILCNHVLEHIINDKKAMQELYRVLKKGGIGIFQVPIDITKNKTFEDFSITDPKERNKLFGQYDHVRIYGMDFFDRLINVGFKVEQCEYTEHLNKEEIIKYCLPKKEIIPICIK
ncbi:MAG: class I SAM-dependent methyltransferase [Flavobacteriaceae bacterium]|nr:MAG: class I SAM-dependent methyltransferase [Bacteroidota bacterium]